MKTYRFICEVASGGYARSDRNFRNDRAAYEAGKLALIEGRFKSVIVKHNGRIVGKFTPDGESK